MKKVFATILLAAIIVLCFYVSLNVRQDFKGRFRINHGSVLAAVINKIDAVFQIKNLFYYDIRSFGAKGNNSGIDNAAIIQGAINQAWTDGTCSVFVPPQIYYISTGLDLPTCVEFWGVGFGQDSLSGAYAGKVGSVVEAMTGFTGPSGYPSHFIVRIAGSLSVGAEADTYNVHVHDLTGSCGGLTGCSGIYIGHSNEQVEVYNTLWANFSDYGEFDCGAEFNSVTHPTACGSNGGHWMHDNQLASYGSWVTSSTQPLVIAGSFADVWQRYTINTTPGPANAMYVQGLDLTIERMHVENSTNGLLLGPTSGVCAGPLFGSDPTHCHGVQLATISHISLGPTGSGYVVVNQNSVDVQVYTCNSNGQTVGVLYDARNGVTTPNSYLGQYWLDNVGDVFSIDNQMNLHAPIFTGSTITMQETASPVCWRGLSVPRFW